nr:hypothetical protein [Tanacetum cinerariifolium]
TPLGYRAVKIRLRATSPHLLLPSTAHRDDILEAGMPLQKRACFSALTSRFEVRKSSSATAARQTGNTLAHMVDYGFVDTVDANIRASESRVITAIEDVSDRVSLRAKDDRAFLRTQVYVHYEDAQDDRAFMRT